MAHLAAAPPAGAASPPPDPAVASNQHKAAEDEGDLELRIIQQRLQLLQCQRAMAALSCQRFMNWLEAAVAQTSQAPPNQTLPQPARRQLQPQPQGQALVRGNSDRLTHRHHARAEHLGETQVQRGYSEGAGADCQLPDSGQRLNSWSPSLGRRVSLAMDSPLEIMSASEYYQPQRSITRAGRSRGNRRRRSLS